MRTCLLVLYLCVGGSCGGSTDGLTLDPGVIILDPLEPGQVGVFSIALHNAGSRAVTVTAVQTGCGCATVEGPTGLLKPKETFVYQGELRPRDIGPSNTGINFLTTDGVVGIEAYTFPEKTVYFLERNARMNCAALEMEEQATITVIYDIDRRNGESKELPRPSVSVRGLPGVWECTVLEVSTTDGVVGKRRIFKYSLRVKSLEPTMPVQVYNGELLAVDPESGNALDRAAVVLDWRRRAVMGRVEKADDQGIVQHVRVFGPEGLTVARFSADEETRDCDVHLSETHNFFRDYYVSIPLVGGRPGPISGTISLEGPSWQESHGVLINALP